MADASIEITRTKKKNAHRWAQMSASGRGELLLINDDRLMIDDYSKKLGEMFGGMRNNA